MPPASWKTHCLHYKDQLVVLFRETPAVCCGPYRSEGRTALCIYRYLNHKYMLQISHTQHQFLSVHYPHQQMHNIHVCILIFIYRKYRCTFHCICTTFSPSSAHPASIQQTPTQDSPHCTNSHQTTTATFY